MLDRRYRADGPVIVKANVPVNFMADDLMAKARAYGMQGRTIDGFDVLDLYDSFKALVDWCRENQKPAFVDLKTYRYLGHSMSDPQKYRTKEEVDQFKAKDSIDRLAAYLMGAPLEPVNGGQSRARRSALTEPHDGR